jgi:pyruvate/2-oxoglutarate/acetoin dehydrogenase E1 component
MREITVIQALNEALREEMRRDPRVYVLGEAVGDGAYGYRVTSGLEKEFGSERVRDTPLTETAIAGSAVGAAIAGLRPVADMLQVDFMFPALDEIMQKAGKWRYTQGANGGMCVPVVFRGACGGYASSASEHSQTLTGLFWHAQGLKLAIPTTPYDAKGLLKTAIRDDNPVVFFEHKRLYGVKGPVPEEEYLVPFGQANVRREGKDITVVATGYCVPLALQAATELAKEGVEVEVIDPRTLEPLDLPAILASVEKTGRLLVADEDTVRCSVASEICFQVQEQAFRALKAPVARVGNPNIPIPASPVLEREVLPSAEKIAAAIRQVMAYK